MFFFELMYFYCHILRVILSSENKQMSVLHKQGEIIMTAFDLSVIVFFIIVTAKAVTDSFSFWKEQEDMIAHRRCANVAPRHLPAPCRPSPANPRFAASIASASPSRRATVPEVTVTISPAAARTAEIARRRRAVARRRMTTVCEAA